MNGAIAGMVLEFGLNFWIRNLIEEDWLCNSNADEKKKDADIGRYVVFI